MNTDGAVNIQDLVLVASNFGQRGENRADVNDDDVVNIADLVLVASALGKAAIEGIQSLCIRSQNPWQIKKLVYLLQKAV